MSAATKPRPGGAPLLALLLATSGHSGVDRIMGNLIPAFAERGVRVDLLRIRGHGPYLDRTPPGVRIVDLGTRHVSTSLPALVRYLRRERPVALLADKDKVNRAALWARHLAHVDTRVFVRIGTTVSKNLERRSRIHRRAQYASMRLFYRWADGVIVPSQGAADDLARISGLPAGRIAVVPSPVISGSLERLAREPAEHPWFIAKDRPVILGVGELSSRKDFSTLIRAFARVCAQRRCRLVILGEGKQRVLLQQLAAELAVGHAVDLPGFVDNPYAYMARADLFVLSSICEGSPVALIEALGVGTPVVSTDCPSGPRETLQDGRYGALVPIGDDRAMAQAMLEALDHPAAPAGIQDAVEPFLLEHSTLRYLAVMGLPR